jgi:hypothetical protein
VVRVSLTFLIVATVVRVSLFLCLMELWNRSECDLGRLENLVRRGLLCPRTNTKEWLSSDGEEYS